ncbi:hypothetical protein GO988_17730 [Hymenobacter sp. HMF4947]|uniref:Uncharacterized protein n=1 Tax=Hymenobacter ginkgonis TaxID=2682976 RepID=A0A7K1TIH0_9BACT|nr:hypothetical protein [Hymenobacter ginkgonis]MVN78172.1 hypothetical protein [Hymenobacter ginkgonis]
MLDLLRLYWAAMRSWPVYTGLAVLGLGLFIWASFASYRLLGDDNESAETELAGPGRAGGHGGAAHFYHK